MSPVKHNPRRIAAEIITKWEKSGGKIDQIRDAELGPEEGWDPRDRKLVTELVFGVVRQVTELDRELDELVKTGVSKMQHRLLAILRVGLYQIRHLDRIPASAAVDEAVGHARKVFGEKAGGLVNAVLRRAVKQANTKADTMSTDSAPSPHQPGQRPVTAFYSKSGPLAQWRSHWRQNFGDEKTDELIRHFASIPPVGLRRNRLKTEGDGEWLEILRAEGVEAVSLEHWPGYAYAKGVSPQELPSFQEGKTTVQDPAAGIAPMALEPQPGENILDLCSAPGGKTALIRELMQGEGRLLSVDKSMKRNRLTREGLKRLGHDSVEVLTADVTSWSDGPFDRVLVDVPCSGTGVAHRRADLLVRRPPLKALQMPKLQRSLIQKAADMVRVGGVLVYSTCSLEPEENEKIVALFEKKHSDRFAREALPETIPGQWRTEKGMARTWPPRDLVDGAFVTRWRRIQ